jgi:hypothetical protein
LNHRLIRKGAFVFAMEFNMALLDLRPSIFNNAQHRFCLANQAPMDDPHDQSHKGKQGANLIWDERSDLRNTPAKP